MKNLDEALSILILVVMLLWIVNGVGGCIKMDEAETKAWNLVKYQRCDKWFADTHYAACHSYEVTDTSYRFYLSGEVVLELIDKGNYSIEIIK